MLILNRKIEEGFIVEVPGYESPIRVSVVQIEGERVKLGIQAPREVLLLRDELVGRPAAREELQRRAQQ